MPHEARIGPILLILVALSSASGCSPADGPGAGAASDPPRSNLADHFDAAPHFGDLEGTFLLVDGAGQWIVRHRPDRAALRFLPASTFKIPNTLIALETGVADGPGFMLHRDENVAPREDWWPASWSGDHTLATALPGSVVWYYQELARRIGPQRMSDYLRRFDYGNQDVSGGIDRFWLTGGLRISAEEQLAFLRRFYDGALGVSRATTALTKTLLVLEETPRYRFSGKTGWAGLGDADTADLGWLVGYIEREGNVYFYAMNIDIRTDEDAAARLRITRAILRDLGLIDTD
jgi:beta-lactamase class D